MSGRYLGRGGRFGDAPSAVIMPSSSPLPGLPPPNTMPMAPSDDFFDPARDGSDIMFYATSLASIANGVSQNSTIQIDSGVDFYWFASTYMVDIAGAVVTESTMVVPLVTVLINDTGSRKNLQNTPVPVFNLVGPGERPYRLVRPRLFRASSTINFTWANYSAGTTYTNLYLVLHGYTKPRGT
jgi:hypothetical protein